MKGLLYLLVIGMAICVNAYAGTKKNRSHFKLVEAYSQRTLPGRQHGAPPVTGLHFLIIWQDTKSPETFFWRGESGWLSCQISKAHKPAGSSKNTPQGMEYITETLTGGVHKGDTLMLSPVTGGKFPIPAEIPAEPKNTLFYKITGSGWLAFPVNNISKKHDISMP